MFGVRILTMHIIYNIPVNWTKLTFIIVVIIIIIIIIITNIIIMIQ